MNKRPIRDIVRFDYKVYDKTGKKIEKSSVKLDRLADKIEKSLDMEKFLDEERKISLEIARFWDEYDLKDLYDVDDIKDGIKELKDLTKRYQDIHVDLERIMEDSQYADSYQNYDNNVKGMTDWVKAARKMIADRKREGQESLEAREKESLIDEEKVKLKTDVKYLKIKIEHFMGSINLENAENVEDIEEKLRIIKDLNEKYGKLYNRLEILYGDDYVKEFGDEFVKVTKNLNEQIFIDHKRTKDIQLAAKMDEEKEKKAESTKIYNQKVKLSEHILEEIESKKDGLQDTCNVSCKRLDDNQLLERKKDAAKINDEFNAFVEKITELVKEIPPEYDEEIFNTWFKCWLISYILQLIHQPKWFHSDRDVKIGDVILFLKSDKQFDKQYQYGLVTDVKVSRDGKIRTIEVQYQNHNESVKRYTNRGSRDIVVIHPVDELGIQFELGAIAKSCGYCNEHGIRHIWVDFEQ